MDKPTNGTATRVEIEHLKTQVTELKSDIKDLAKEHADLNVDFRVLATKASIWGAMAGVGGGGIATAVAQALGG